MARSRPMALAIVLLGIAGCAGEGFVRRAEAGVERFHDRYNRGMHAANHAAASAHFRSTTPEPAFVEIQEWVRGHLGQVRSTERLRVVQQAGKRGWKAGIVYRTTFERGVAIEEYGFRLEGGLPLLSGYYIESDQLPSREAPRPVSTAGSAAPLRPGG